MSRSWTPNPHPRGGYFNCKIVLQGIGLILCSVMLASCGFSSGSNNTPKEPAAASSQTAGSALPALTSPPGLNDRPGSVGTVSTPKTPEGLPALQPPRGVNTVSLFSENIRDKDARLDRLENAVQGLRNDFDSMAPAITRLVAVESDIQDLITQLETLTLQDPAPRYQAPPPAVMPVPQSAPMPLEPVPEQVMAPAPAPEPVKTMAPVMDEKPKAMHANNAVYAIRIGEHPDKTRIVLDLKGSADFSYDLDNGERLLIIELPSLKWNATSEKSYKSVRLLSSHKATSINDGAGTRLILQLKSPATVVYSGKMSGKHAGEKKIILDIAPDSSSATTQ